MEYKGKKSDYITGLISFLIAVGLFVLFLYIFKYVPFGVNSLAARDINLCQLDEYGYLKDALEGKNSFGYTFSMALGGDTANVITYSMSSPLNLLLLFFDKSHFHEFFSLLVLLKIGLIAFTCTFFLARRFKGDIKPFFSILLGICYAYSQYGIAQIVNIFWLDGMIMLPLICLGIYRIIEKKSPYLLTISVALAVMFNWYSGATCCLFSIFWFFYELLLYRSENSDTFHIKELFVRFIMYASAGLVGGLLSMILFLPTVSAVQNGNRGSFNWELLKNVFNGNLLTVISNNSIGAQSSKQYVSLYCSGFAIISCMSYFFMKKEKKSSKWISAFFLLFVILTYYWQPLHLLFSLMKNATSFWSRYSFTGIFTIIFIAARFCAKWDDNNDVFVPVGISYVIVFSFLNFALESTNELKLIVLTIVCLLSYVLFVYCSNAFKNRKYEKILLVLLSAVCLTELFYNAKIYLTSNKFHVENTEEYKDYINNEEQIISDIQELDNSYYRINKSAYREYEQGGITAHYNEALMFNYWGVSSYTNSPDDRQRLMLDHMGYRTNGENYYIVNTSVVPADSLIGVKYFISPFKINGYRLINDIQPQNGKSVYENPFYLPMAFLYQKNDIQKDDYTNPFESINNLYSQLVGRDINIFIKLSDYTIENISDEQITYHIKRPQGNFGIYANLPWENSADERIWLNDDYRLTLYSRWGSPSVFYVPSEDSDNEVSFSVWYDKLSIMDEQFYALDLNLLKEVTEELRKNPVNSLDIKNKHVKIDVTSNGSQVLYTSIPYDKGWVITDNGNQVEPDLFENCLMQFPLSEGKHVIEMKYKVPGLKLGCICSFVGCLISMIYIYCNKKKKVS